MGGYVFSTNNSGAWVNDSLVSFGSTIPWDTWNNEGTLLESFNNSAEWTKEGVITVSDDLARYVEGGSSIKINTGTEPTLAIRKTINLNLSDAKNFYFWFYTDRPLSPDSTPYSTEGESTDPAIILYFSSDSAYSKSFTCSVFGSELKTGWNKIVIDKNNCYQDTAVLESWTNIMVSMQFRIYVSDSTSTNINIDNLRYDYNGGDVNKTVVIMTFDDGWKTQLTAYNIMKANNQKGVAFVYPQAQMEEWPDFMSTAELTTLYNDGWDISSHSMSHYDLDNASLTYSELVYEITESKNWLNTQGFTRSSGFFAYPYHKYNDTVLSLVNSTYKMARNDFGADEQPHIHIDDPDNIPFLVKATEILSTTDPNYILSVIDRAVSQKSLLVLSFHQINDTLSDETMWSQANFQTVSDYLKTKVDEGWLDVMTFSDYYSKISNKPTSAWANVTKTLTNDVNVSVKWCVYAKDTADGWSSSCTSPFGLVTTAEKPAWSNVQYASAANYSPSGQSEFNVTWNSTVGTDKVLITVRNSTHVLVDNASMNLLSGDNHLGNYSYSINLPAGNYNWTSYANDTLGRMNSTGNLAFTINKADNVLNLYMNNGTEYGNQDVSAVYGTPTTVTGVCTAGTCSLFKNGLDATAENGTQMTLPAGNYQYILFATETQNYTGNSTSYNLTVARASNPISLYLNGVEYEDNENVTIVYGTQTNMTGTCTIGACNLFRSGPDGSGLDASLDNNTQKVLAAGLWQYLLTTPETQNYSGNTTVYNITVEKAPNPVTLSLNDTVDGNATYTYPEAVGASAASSFGEVYMYRDGVLVANASEETLFASGTYEYHVNATGNENYSDNTTGLTYYAIVNKGTPVLSIEFNPSNTVEKGTQSSATGIESNDGDDDVTYVLYRGDAQVDNPDVAVLDVNSYMYTFNSTEGENWTAGSVSNLFAVQSVNIVNLPSGGGGGSGPSTVTYTSSDDNETTEETPDSSFLGDDIAQAVVTNEGETCIEDWMCLDWSDCSEGMQTRACVDKNGCGTEANKPMESQECEEQSSLTGLFTVITSPIVIGIMALVTMIVIFIFLPVREKLKF